MIGPPAWVALIENPPVGGGRPEQRPFAQIEKSLPLEGGRPGPRPAGLDVGRLVPLPILNPPCGGRLIGISLVGPRSGLTRFTFRLVCVLVSERRASVVAAAAGRHLRPRLSLIPRAICGQRSNRLPRDLSWKPSQAVTEAGCYCPLPPGVPRGSMRPSPPVQRPLVSIAAWEGRFAGQMAGLRGFSRRHRGNSPRPSGPSLPGR